MQPEQQMECPAMLYAAEEMHGLEIPALTARSLDKPSLEAENVMRILKPAATFACLVLLSGCGPSANDPPTNSEISGVFANICKTSVEQNVSFFDFTGAKRADTGVTQAVMGTKVHEVSVTMSYRSKSATTIQCIGNTDMVNYQGKQRCLFFQVVNPGAGIAVNAGDTFTCDVTLDFQKADEGWLPAGFSSSYLIKR